MLKYTTELKNLNNGEIANTNVGEVEEDTATNPQVTVVLPIIQNIDMSTESKEPLVYKSYHEVEYGSEAWESTLAPDCVATEEFEDKQAAWTWHVEDSKGNVVDKDEHDILSVTLEMYDKIAGIKYLRQRRLMRWTAKGTLKPGQKIVIDFMVPVSTEDTVVEATELLSCKSYGFKPGAFVPYIPPSDEAKNFAYEIDARDVNDNGEKNVENTVTVSVNNIGFSGSSAFNRTKKSFSEYGTGMNESGNGANRPSLVPEGTNYEFVSSIIDPDTQSTSKGFKQPVLYDVLPFVGDTQLVAQQTGEAPSRGTNWRGYLHLDSIKVKTQTGTEAKQMTDGKDVNIWVGPFKDNGTQITKLPISDLPNVDQTGSIEFYNELRGSDSEKQKYFVRLSKLLALRTSNPVLYSELEKHAQAIYVEPTEDYVLKANTKMSVSYKLKAPLNIPLSKNYVPEDSENILEATKDVDGWNSFVAQSDKDKAVESPFAGVYLAAPADRGYIGHYVWLDESYNAHFTDEGDYIQRDGRWLLNKATKDLDYDGQIDDPGINNVKVELLTEKGYPVNRLGEAVIEKDGNYYVIDEDTGKISKDSMGSPILTTYGPMSYTTEKDVYGHDGYFIISNIKPGKYNLRYTFPKDSKYNKYAVTTRKLGVTETSMKVYRPGEEDTLPDLGNAGKGDEPSDAKKVESLTIQTTEPIQIDAIGEDPTTYAAYDEKMTSYDLGVAPSFVYGGYAWMDIQYDSEGQPIANSINGQMEDAEQKLKNVGIHIYEVKADGSHVTAYDKNGKAIDTIYTDDKGYFKTTLYPYRSYIAIADTKKVDDVIQPSPVTLSTRALQYEKDNDLSYNEDLNKNATNVFAILPTAADYNMGTCVEGQYGSYDRLGFGYVPAGIGAIGKYVFNDENYDGIRNEYVDKDGYYVSEPGIDDVKLVLEKYYYKDGNWVLLNDHFAETTSLGCSYTFIVDSAYADETGTEEEGTKYLCGYKVKVDMSTVPTGFTPTKYYMNNGVSDSDLPLTGDGYRYLMKDPVIIASEADKSTLDEYKLTKDDKTYDISKAQIITKYDAGFTSVDRAEIDGVVWDDKNYDGERGKYTDTDGNEIDEPGIEDVEVQLVPYVYENNQWKLLKKENLADQSIYAEYEPKVTTIADGTYSFTGVRSIAVMSDNTKCIVGYKVRINTDIEAMNYGITKYRNANPTVDSDLWKTNKSEFILNENDEYIITAKQIPNKDVDNEYGAEDLKNQDNLLIHNALGWFDINKVTDYSGSDAGLTDFRQSHISGRVWADENYDGIMDASENGMPDEEVTMKRYYLESLTDGTYSWVEDTTYTSPVVKTDAQGDYLFDNLDTHIYKDGKYYLAGYRVFMAKAPNTSLYGVTLYRKYDPDTQRGSDLKKLELTENDDYIIIADSCGKATGAGNGSSAAVKRNELAHVTEYKGTYYDLITAKAYEKLDAGYRLYPNALIQGNVFEDFNYDGIINTAENGKTDGFSAELKAALGNGTIEVKATAYYFDGSQWKPYKDTDGAQVYYTDTVDATSVDGSYEISVPTKATVDGQNYLAGYKLEVNMIPDGYHITKHKADGLTDKSNALIRMDSPKYSVTKTLPDRPYAGTIKEEMDGYIIGANPSEDTASANIIRGYDIAAGRVVKQYNVGYTAHETSKIEGIAFEDENDNGKYDKADDTLMPGVKVAIKRYVYNVDDNTWTKAPDAGAPTAEYYATTVTDNAGHYVFDNLPTHEDRYDTAEKPVLYGYTVWLQEMPVNADGEEMAATFYQANKDADDSALIADSMQIIKAETNPNLDADELKDGNTMIAHKLSKVDNERSDIVEGYDCTVGSPRDGYNLGFVDYEKGSIEGCVFDDKNMDGIIDKDDAKFENISIGLKRFVYEDGQWKPAQPEDEEYFAQTTTDANGNYIFNNLDIFTGKDDDKQIYGYEVWALTTPDDHVITRYQMNNGKNDSAVLLNSQIIKKSTTLSEVLDGKLVVARKVDNPTQEGLNQTYVVEGYDVVRATHLKDYNAGYTVLRKGEINGTVFEDADYDGYLDEEEQVWEGVEVGLKRFVYEDGQWQLAQNEDEEYLATTVTDADGHYVFDGLRTHVKKETGNKLYGYEVWVITDADGYAVTRYGKDSFLRINDQIIKADTTLPEMLDGKTIVAHKVTEQDNIDGINDTYFVEGYNVVLAEIRGDYNAGYFKEQKGSISGTVFEDVNYDGKIDDQDVMMKDIEVGLKRFVYTDGAWVEDTTVATKPDEGTDTGKPDTDDSTGKPDADEGTEDIEKPATQKFFATTTTDEKGHYIFDNLDTHLKETDKNKLYGYEVWIIKDPDGYAVTRYGEDSFLLVNGQVIKADTELPEMLDGKVVVAHKVTKDEIIEDIDEIYLEEGYNVVLGEDLEQYNAGYSKVQKGSISGSVFDDVNYDGLIDGDDDLLKDIEIGLKRFVYMDGQWKPAQKEGEDFFAKTVTDDKGNYLFGDLDVYYKEEGIHYLYGYELYVINHDNRQTTKYQMNNGDKDSAVLTDTYQIIKKEDGREELFHGAIVLAKKADKDANPNTPYIVEGYDIVKGMERDQNNAGFAASHNYSISGLVWVDNDRDGICNEETFAEGIDVTLEKYYLSDGKWIATGDETSVTVQTGKDGTYLFENLELYGIVNEKQVVYGYRVKVPTIPEQYGVTVFHAEAEGNRSDLNEKTSYLEPDGDTIVLADKADENTPKSYNIDGYNISHGESVSSVDAGIIPYGVGSIAGIVFEDANANGIIDDEEEIFEDKKVYLEYRNGSDDEAKFERYPGGKAVTDDRGFYMFDELPVLDENNQPYEYRVTMERPDGRLFTKTYDFVVFGQKKSNILSPDTEKGDKDKTTVGITPIITLAVKSDKKNSYNLKYELDGYNHKNAYLGFTRVEESDRIQTGFDTRYLWILLAVMALMTVGTVTITVTGKKRRKEAE